MSHRVTTWYPYCNTCPSLSQFLSSLLVFIPHLLHNLWPSQQAVHIGTSNFYENKMLPKPPAGWSFPKAPCGCRSACLWASLHSGRLSVLEGISGCCVTQEENRYCRRKVVRPRCHFICRFNSPQNNFSKISSSERETLVRNSYCSPSQVVAELNRGISHLNVSASQTLHFASGKNPVVSKGSFLKVKVLTLAKETLPQASFGLWAQGSQWNTFLQL